MHIDPLKIQLRVMELPHLYRYVHSHDRSPTPDEIAEAQRAFEAGLSADHFHMTMGRYVGARTQRFSISVDDMILLDRMGWKFEKIRILVKFLFSSGWSLTFRQQLVPTAKTDGELIIAVASKLSPDEDTIRSLDAIADMIDSSAAYTSGGITEALVLDLVETVELFKEVPSLRWTGADYVWKAYHYASGGERSALGTLRLMRQHIREVGDVGVWSSWMLARAGKQTGDREQIRAKLRSIVKIAKECRVNVDAYGRLVSIGVETAKMKDFIDEMGRLKPEVKI